MYSYYDYKTDYWSNVGSSFFVLHFLGSIGLVICVTQFTGYLQDMARVSYHFVRGKHPRKFASTLVNFMGKVRLLLILNAIYSGIRLL